MIVEVSDQAVANINLAANIIQIRLPPTSHIELTTQNKPQKTQIKPPETQIKPTTFKIEPLATEM